MLAAHALAVAVGATTDRGGDRLCRTVSRAVEVARRAVVPPIPGRPMVVTVGADQPLRSTLLLAASMSHRGPPVSRAMLTGQSPDIKKATTECVSHPWRPSAPSSPLRAPAVALSIGLASGAAPAWAHVRVDADDPAPGSTSVVTFRVPGESENGALTTKLSVELPDVASRDRSHAGLDGQPGARQRRRAPSARSPGRPIRRWASRPTSSRCSGCRSSCRGRQRHLPSHADLFRRNGGALGSGPAAGRR